jgi:hypothetical protein
MDKHREVEGIVPTNKIRQICLFQAFNASLAINVYKSN